MSTTKPTFTVEPSGTQFVARGIGMRYGPYATREEAQIVANKLNGATAFA